MRLLFATSVLIAFMTAVPVAEPASAASAGAATASHSLRAVDCVSARSCWAVGVDTTGTVTRTLIEHWNGSKWSVVTSPSVTRSADTFLGGVSCAGTSDCWAVGAAAVGTTKMEPIAEHWNGRRWSLTVLPEPSGRPADELRGVSCLTATRCWTVGDSARAGSANTVPLAEHWTGKRWFVVLTGRTGPFSGLEAVACRRDTDCWATGFREVPTLTTQAEHWNGRKWSAVATPPGTGGGLAGVSCPGSDCLAVGIDGFPSALAERWNGAKWSITPVPNLAKTGSSAVSGLAAVSCVTESNCFAVGSLDEERNTTVVLRWQGSKWVRVTSPNPAGSASAELQGVSCRSARDCWAVGAQGKTLFGSTGATLAEHWNGRRWTIVRTP